MIHYGLLVLRLGAGLMMMNHGWGKLANWAEYSQKFGDPIGVGPQVSLALAIFAELFCAFAVVLGLATRLAIIPLLVTMTVAALIVHAGDPFQKKELALMYFTVFTALMLTGPGKLSLDNWWAGKRQAG